MCIRDSLGKVGLCAEEYIDREMSGALSGGEAKRIEIATVLARNVKRSVFDEPEAGIDLWSCSRLVETFEEIRNGTTGSLVIISHQERILSIADEIKMCIRDRRCQYRIYRYGYLCWLYERRNQIQRYQHYYCTVEQTR